jgi:ribokinase
LQVMTHHRPASPAFDVIVCGSLHLDIVVHAPALPKIDETAVGDRWEQVPGGKGGNQAVQAARHGAKTAMIGRVGSDGFGQTLLENLKKASVDVMAVAIDPQLGSGMSVAILQDNGEYGAVIVSGSNLAMDSTSLESTWDVIGGAKVLVLQNEVPHAVNVAAAAVARQNGALVVLNAAPARAMAGDLLDNVDVLVVNRVEAEAMSGFEVVDRDSAIAALQHIGMVKSSIIITLGGKGLVVCPRAEAPVSMDAVPVQVRSTHGAGDCFVGVLAAQLAANLPLVEACRIANQQAAVFVSRQ